MAYRGVFVAPRSKLHATNPMHSHRMTDHPLFLVANPIVVAMSVDPVAVAVGTLAHLTQEVAPSTRRHEAVLRVATAVVLAIRHPGADEVPIGDQWQKATVGEAPEAWTVAAKEAASSQPQAPSLSGLVTARGGPRVATTVAHSVQNAHLSFQAAHLSFQAARFRALIMGDGQPAQRMGGQEEVPVSTLPVSTPSRSRSDEGDTVVA